jgi:hypothetical protein
LSQPWIADAVMQVTPGRPVFGRIRYVDPVYTDHRLWLLLRLPVWVRHSVVFQNCYTRLFSFQLRFPPHAHHTTLQHLRGKKIHPSIHLGLPGSSTHLGPRMEHIKMLACSYWALHLSLPPPHIPFPTLIRGGRTFRRCWACPGIWCGCHNYGVFANVPSSLNSFDLLSQFLFRAFCACMYPKAC